MCPTSFLNINFNKISTRNLFSALNLIILNKNKCINCGATEICFELFQRAFLIYFKNKTISKCDQVVESKFTSYLQQLIHENKFSRKLFCKLLFKEIKDIPLKLIAWLDENNVYFFTQHCMNNSTSNISKQFINLIESNSKHEISFIFMKILICAYNVGIINSSKLFTIKCRKILDEILNTSLTEFDNEGPKLINILPIIGELDCFVYGEVIQQLKKQILQKVLTFNENVTFQDVFVLQEIWSLKNVSEKNILNYYELIKSYTLEDLLQLIINISERKLNWKFALILISVYVRKNPSGHKKIKDIINRKLQILFSDQMKTISTKDLKPSNELLTSIIFIRQICYEQDSPQFSYSEWYSNTFGPDTNLRTGCDPAAFNLLLATLTSVINKEPIHILQTYIERSMRTPSGCQNDMLVFKDVCRVQLSRLVQSEQININNCNIPAVILLEDGLNRFDCTWALKQPNICKSLLPFVINDPKYDRLKEMIIANGSINQDDVLACEKLAVMKNDNTEIVSNM